MLSNHRSSGSVDRRELPSTQLIYVEDLTPTMDSELAKSVLTPYLQSVHSDLCLRSAPPAKGQINSKSIDKVTFVEYINLPGVLSDRFLALATQGSADQRVSEESFVSLLLRTFSSNLDTKMKLAFDM